MHLEIFETIFWSDEIVLFNERTAPITPGSTRINVTRTTRKNPIGDFKDDMLFIKDSPIIIP
jgi:hypothetical protein